MEEKVLGKISKVEFGQYSADHPFLFGISFTFDFKGSGVGCGGKYTLNLNPIAWEKHGGEDGLAKELLEHVRKLEKILKDAKVNHVSQLKGKPVEVTIKNRMFEDFRILTEVI